MSEQICVCPNMMPHQNRFPNENRFQVLGTHDVLEVLEVARQKVVPCEQFISRRNSHTVARLSRVIGPNASSPRSVERKHSSQLLHCPTPDGQNSWFISKRIAYVNSPNGFV